MPRKRRRSSPARLVALASDAAGPTPLTSAPAAALVGKHGFNVRLELATANALQDRLTAYRAAFAQDFSGPSPRGTVALESLCERRLAEFLIQRLDASIVRHMDNVLGQLARMAARTTRAAKRASRLAAPESLLEEEVLPNPNADAEAAWVKLTRRRANAVSGELGAEVQASQVDQLPASM
jgi:hypothetical protein